MTATASTTAPAIRPLARTITLRGSAAIVAMAVLTTALLWTLASALQRDSAGRYALAEARAVAASIDAFDRTLEDMAVQAFTAFRRELAPTFEVLDAVQGRLASYGEPLDRSTTAVDRFAAEFPGGVATVFARQGEDWRRISTSLKKEDGQRAVGTLLDRRHPAYARLMQGQTYVGRASLFGKPYVTVYEPALDAQGKVVGALFVGLDTSKVQSKIASLVAAARLYDSGGLYVLDTRAGAAEASLAFHPTHAGQPLARLLGDDAAAWVERLRNADGARLDGAPGVLRPGGGDARVAAAAPAGGDGWWVVAEVADAEMMAGVHRAMALLTLAIVAGAGAMVWGLWVSARRIGQPLAALVADVQAIGAGDLSRPLVGNRRDEVGAIVRALDVMREQLRVSMLSVHQASDSIHTASTEIAGGNADLSARTEQAASSLQQTAGSMEQLTGAIGHTADAAAQANQLATSAAQVARRGGEVAAQVVATMQEIDASSKKIADIIGVIDGIAFQTNILALNAAVEAARAGEQGRGFAVVASEVRSLAQRSAEAAREIKALIDASLDKVHSGSRLVGDAGATMREIVTSVQRVTDIIAEISAAAREQSAGVGQVNAAVADLDRMTQQNAALVEQSAAAAESLKDQARRLTTLVASFRLGDTTAAAPHMPMHTPSHTTPHAASAAADAGAPAAGATVPVGTAAAPVPATRATHSPSAPATAAAPRTARLPVLADAVDDDWQQF